MKTYHDGFREGLPTENHDVWCERCQRVHGYWAMTRDEYDAIVSKKAKDLADIIDADIVAKIAGMFK